MLLLILASLVTTILFDRANAERVRALDGPDKDEHQSARHSLTATLVVALLVCGGWSTGILSLYESTDTDSWMALQCSFAVAQAIAAVRCAQFA